MVRLNRYNAGITILEVLIAFALVGLGVTLTMQVFHRSADQTAALSREHWALRTLENAIESVRATPFEQLEIGTELPLPRLLIDEDSPDAVPQGFVRLDAHPDSPRLLHVTAQVQWIERGPRVVTRSLTTLLADDS